MNRFSDRKILILCTCTFFTVLIVLIIICGLLFSAADRKSDEARILNMAVIETASIAESLKASDGDLEKAGQSMTGYGFYDTSENSLTFYYDKEMHHTSKTGSIYTADIKKTAGDGFFSYEIIISENSSEAEIYSLSFNAL